MRLLHRRAVLAAAAIALCGMAQAQPQGWPSRPIRIVVPFPAGGPTDIAARVVGQVIGESLKTSVIVENKAGAHGFIGVTEAAKAPADGYTLKKPAVARRLTDLGAVPVGRTPEKLAAFQQAEQAKWGRVIQAAKIKAD